MKTVTQQFCKIYTQFYGEQITSPKQIETRMTGVELKEFCDFYFEERLGESSLKHFFSKKKRFYVGLGLIIGFAISLVVFLMMINDR